MSDTESEENASDLDFSASEDEYVPPKDAESDIDSDDDESEEDIVDEPIVSKKTNKTKRKQTARKSTVDDDDSDSSVENYLVNPNEIDFASEFFNPSKVVAPNVPQFDCNFGLNLSDSEGEEVLEAVPSSSQAAKPLDFIAHENFNKEFESAKDHLRNFKSTNFGQDGGEVGVSQLLAIGEPALVAKKSKQKKSLFSSDESDFEEVEEYVKTEKKSDVEVHIGPVVKKKADKLQAEIEASIKRKINRRKKENQLMMHKVHVLSWIAYGNYVNKILNSTELMEMVFKYIPVPSANSYPKDKTDQNYFEQIIKWYKTTVGLKSKEQNCNLKCLPPIATSLALQIQSKMAICKKDFVFIFIILLRSLGIQCRLAINFSTVPLRPPAKDLCVISTKSTEKPETSDNVKKEKKSTSKGKESSSGKSKEVDVKKGKSKPKAGKSMSRTTSISAQKLEILPKSPEPSDKKKTLKSKIQAALESAENQSSDRPNEGKKKNLKRSSVSIQSVNDNNKRARLESVNDSKADTVLNGTKSAIKKVLKAESVDTKSPISRRTRTALARRASVSSSDTVAIPQLDGGDDKKSKKGKPLLYKLKFPLRSRSRSPTLSSTLPLRRSKSVVVEPARGRSTSKNKVSLASKSKSKSPAAASEHNSRKSTMRKPRSSSPSPAKLKKVSKSQKEQKTNTKSLAKSSKPTTSAATLSPLKKASNSEKKLSSDTEEQKKNSKKGKPRAPRASSVPVNSLTLSPSKLAPNSDSELSSQTKDSKSTSEATSSTSSIAATTSRKGNPKTKSSSSSKVTESSKTVDAAPTNNKKSKPTARSTSMEKSTKATVKRKPNKSDNPPDSDSDFAGPPMKKSAPATKKPLPVVATSANSKNAKPTARSTSVGKSTKVVRKRKLTQSASSDSDFVNTPKKSSSPAIKKPLPRQVETLKKRIDRRILSTDDESNEPLVKKEDMNYWIEVYCEAEQKWICIDLFKLKVNCVDEIKKKATKPIAYVFGWNNSNKIKDISPRYCSQWNTTTRKLRVETEWLDEAISRYKEPLSQRCVAEDRELEEIHAQTPIPTSISELKNHPLYVLPRHLLKFEGIYPPNPVPVGYIRDEPIYSRLCLHTLHSREIWVKQARVVKPGEIPYKIVKARPKWDRLANKMLEPQPLEIFGRWQTDPYDPPTAENGIVPRNAYGNVELFKPEMLPKKTVHLRLAGLNRVCAKLKIDCAQAVVGFDFHGGSSHPTFDGFVVCEEFAELVTERWCEEQEEAYRKSKEKQTQKIYDNWKKLIKGVLIRERLQRKYNFTGKDAAESSEKKK